MAENGKAYARRGASDDKSGWQTLQEHCSNVARRAEALAYPPELRPFVKRAAQLHDAGKASDEWQAYLDGAGGGKRRHVDHKTAGARRVLAENPGADMFNRMMATAIVGHHTRTPDYRDPGGAMSFERRRRLLGEYLADAGFDALDVPAVDDAAVLSVAGANGITPAEVRALEGAVLRYAESCDDGCAGAWNAAAEALYFLVQMTTSCLVQADGLDAEAHMEPAVAEAREHSLSRCDGIAALRSMLDAKVAGIEAACDDTPVNRARRLVRDRCAEAARREPGLYLLDADTGLGKTVSALSFALGHAARHGKGRVVYTAPYKAICEQTGNLCLDTFGSANVTLHWADFDQDTLGVDDDGGGSPSGLHALTACDWRRPIVVTTVNQLLESLHSDRTAKRRKLCSVANSVIVIDEPQAIRSGAVAQTLSALRTLVGLFGCTVLFVTATEPGFESRSPLAFRYDRILSDADREEVRRLAGTRVAYEFTLADTRERPSAEFPSAADVALMAAGEGRALCVFNTRAAASDASLALDGEGIAHWTITSCKTPHHRAAELADIRRALAEGGDCIVLATKTVEAGVDLDFPVAYKEFEGLDSIVQAGGRVNREGKMGRPGAVRVFTLGDRVLRGDFASAAVRSRRAIACRGPREVLGIDRSALERYHGLVDDDDTVYRMVVNGWRQHDVSRNKAAEAGKVDAKAENARRGMYGAVDCKVQYGEVARCYKLIEEGTVPVVVLPPLSGLDASLDGLFPGSPADVREAWAAYQEGSADQGQLNLLHRSAVNVEGWEVRKYVEAGVIAPDRRLVREDGTAGGYVCDLESSVGCYSARWGLVLNPASGAVFA